MRTQGRTAAAAAFLAALLFSSAGTLQAGNRHLLWAVEGKAATVYLMGAIHLLKPESYPLDEAMEEAYRRSGSVMFETDLGEIYNAQHTALLLAKGMYLDGRSLEDDISPRTMDTLRGRARELGIAMSELAVMKPWLCSLTIYLKTLEKRGLDVNYGLDSHFFLRARLDGKKTLFLESPDFQVNLLASLADGDQEDLLRQTLLEEGLFAGGFDGLYRAWEEGDAEWIAAHMAEAMAGSPGLKEMFLDSRNRAWIGPLEELLEGGEDSLVVVGAGHLVGRGSVVELLQQRGWNIRQL